MAKKVEIEWNHAGFQAILISPEVTRLVQQQTNQIAANANAKNSRGGKGFGSATGTRQAYGSKRAMGFVYTTDHESMVAEAEDKALSRAV